VVEVWLNELAEEDLKQALTDIEGDDEDVEAALEWYTLLEQRLEELAVSPQAYRARPENRGLRCCFVGDYSMWYRLSDDLGVEVRRILPPGVDVKTWLLHG
jgi:plasmid stabilization system protein ParE